MTWANESPTDSSNELMGSEATPENVVIQMELSADIQRALEQLTPNLRAAIVLVCLQGKSAKDTRTGITMGGRAE